MDDQSLSPLADLLRQVRVASDDAADPVRTVEAARRGALAAWEPARPAARARLVAVALAAAAALGFAAFFLAARRPAITYVVGEDAETAQLGTWIAAERQATPVRFSEGTVVTLASGSRARVTRADADGASVLLERGTLRARVVHANDATAWSIHAGPFEITVIGTELDVSWDPARDTLDVKLIEGRILVNGPLLDDGRALVAGERLQVSIQDGRSELSKGPPFEDSTAAAVEPPPTDHAPASSAAAAAPNEVAPPGEHSPPADRAHREAAQPDWRALAAKGRHREAMAAIEREGFQRVLERASSPELIELADVARYAGSFAHAREALLRARRLGARGRSAFLLGKLAADHQGTPSGAITWFQTYLDEEPRGGLREQALGRLIELRRQIGDAAGARAAATTYLQRYPQGAYASLARAAAAP